MPSSVLHLIVSSIHFVLEESWKMLNSRVELEMQSFKIAHPSLQTIDVRQCLFCPSINFNSSIDKYSTVILMVR